MKRAEIQERLDEISRNIEGLQERIFQYETEQDKLMATESDEFVREWDFMDKHLNHKLHRNRKARSFRGLGFTIWHAWSSTGQDWWAISWSRRNQSGRSDYGGKTFNSGKLLVEYLKKNYKELLT